MTQKNSAGRMKVFGAFLLLFGPALLLIFISTRSCDHKFKELEDYGKAMEYSFEDINGKKRYAKEFRNKIVLVTTLQETCPDSCAIRLWNLNQAIYQHIKNNKKKMKEVIIISFATDGFGKPLDDLSTIHAALKDQVEEYNPNIWILAKGPSEKLWDFENNKKRLLQEGDEYFGGKSYQELMLLLDKKNHLRMVLSGKTEGMIRRMKEHIALLQKQYDKENLKNSKP
jgi:cytochrome oxidase Cu insertion factor (SCO1/SenC/PrrC family)